MNVVFALLKTQKSVMKLTSKSSILQYLIEHLNNNGHPIECETVGGDDITPFAQLMIVGCEFSAVFLPWMSWGKSYVYQVSGWR